jgi:thiol-disulfide isomerase/thioredoxin
MRFREVKAALAAIVFAVALAAGARADGFAPPLALSDLAGESQSLQNHRGKIVVLNFWATWCGPCLEEMPMLADIQKKYGDAGVVVIGVSLDEKDTRPKVPEFVRKRKINFPIWLDGTTEDLERFDLGEALPATAFIDREGRIVGRVLGMLRKRDLRNRVEWLLGEGKGKPPEPLVNNLGF